MNAYLRLDHYTDTKGHLQLTDRLCVEPVWKSHYFSTHGVRVNFSCLSTEAI